MMHRHHHHGIIESYADFCGIITVLIFKGLWWLLRGIYRLVRAGVRKLQQRKNKARGMYN